MKIGNLLMYTMGILAMATLFIMTLLLINYQEHTTLFHQILFTFITSGISCISLYAIKNEK